MSIISSTTINSQSLKRYSSHGLLPGHATGFYQSASRMRSEVVVILTCRSPSLFME